MIIRAIHLHPFAGISDRPIALESGLNVVLGPNEAGKTTLVNGLCAALFLPTGQTPAQFRREMGRYLPINGGDTIRVTLELEEDGKGFGLKKTWGTNGHSELKLPGGELLTGPDEVQEKLADLLALRQGTYDNVLIAYQARLANTLDELSGESSETQDLAEMLRAAVFATDGVSIDALGDGIEARMAGHFSRWDEELQRPENNRGIDHPWKNRVGTLLQAYYERESLGRERDRTDAFERELDSLNEKINARSREREALDEAVGKNAAIVADAEKRAKLDAQRSTLGKEEEELRKISKEWPKIEERVEARRKDHGKGAARLEALQKELAQAKAHEAGRAKREQLVRAEKKAADLNEAREKLSKLSPVPPDRKAKLEELDRKLKELSVGLEAGRLRMKLTPKKDFGITVRKDLESESEVGLHTGDPLELEAGGRLSLRHDDWELEVQSGEVAFEEVIAAHDEARSGFDALLKELKADSLKMVQERHEVYREKAAAVENLKTQLGEVLAGTTIEELKSELGGDDEKKAQRASAEIAEEKGKLDAEQGTLQKEIESSGEQLAGWKEKFTSQDALLDTLVEARAKVKEKDKEIEALKPLPEDIENAEAFIAEFREGESRLKAIKEQEMPELLIARADLEKSTPEKSLQELDEELGDAKARYDQCVKEGKALKKISDAFGRLREQLDQGTLDPWIANLKEVLEPLTGGRYREIDLEVAEADRADDLTIPYEALSMGTRACLGLAVRLSMAKHFLENRKGFLLLDDPLVDLDPERQEAAVKILRRFAEERQVIILTCHPRHAELLGGNQILMERPAAAGAK